VETGAAITHAPTSSVRKHQQLRRANVLIPPPSPVFTDSYGGRRQDERSSAITPEAHVDREG
jgi:hypothetical protein